MSPVRGYQAEPCHAITGGVGVGYRAAVAGLSPGLVLAVDGPAAVDWDVVAAEICQALAARELTAKQLDMREHFAAWPDILELTTSAALPDDPDFAPLSRAGLAAFFADVPEAEAAPHAVIVVFGPEALAELAARPFRTRPTFNTASWGGHWAQERFGFNPEAPNTALGYELIAPESGILVGNSDGARVEIPLQALVTLHPAEISATPYLYSLRFYDWLRKDRAGRQRPVHVGHAFENLDATPVRGRRGT